MGLTTPYFSHLPHLKVSNTGFSHSVCDAHIYIYVCVCVCVVVMMRNMKCLQNLFEIMNAKNPVGSSCTERDTLQYECVHVVDSTGLRSSGRL